MLLNLILSHCASVKMMHWMSKSYGQHEALGSLHAALESQGDKLAEALIGASQVSGKKASTLTQFVQNKSGDAFANFYTSKHACVSTLQKMHDQLKLEVRPALADDSLQSIVDDAITAYRVCIYLCSMTA